MMFKLIVLLVSMASVLHLTSGMQCALCVDIKADLSAAYNVDNFQNYIDKISALRNRECVNKNTANTLLSCEHRKNKCGTINGDVVLSQAYFGIYLRQLQSVDV
ncbi:uncharacterized protein [Mytilus edulis]|uniref:uncharacterized protein isoform X2 n=1 Tax=Mytilus edulis TaxID=6550 RepID=UPI0039EED78F